MKSHFYFSDQDSLNLIEFQMFYPLVQIKGDPDEKCEV